jgi:hypothetical protein
MGIQPSQMCYSQAAVFFVRCIIIDCQENPAQTLRCMSAFLPQVCDSYCVCTILPDGPSLDSKMVSTPRKRSGNPPFVKTETIKKSDAPRWKTGVAQFPVTDGSLSSNSCLELCLMAQRMLGSELLGRTNVELAALLSETHTDRYAFCMYACGVMFV